MLRHIQARPFGTLCAAFLLLHSDFSCSAGTGSFAPTTGVEVLGTVRFVDVDGGCWQLQARNGARYELRPGQAPSRILVDGAQVVLVVRFRTDLTSACMVGDIVDVEHVKYLQLP